jgi:beta-xylosidase
MMKTLRLSILGIAILAFLAVVLLGRASNVQALSGSFGTHDPSVIQAGSCYYAFGTGTWLPILKSCTSMYGPWSFLKNTFSSLPSWIPGAIGATPSNLWAPDINFVNGQYRLYYAASTFGSNKSVIGLATASNIEGPWTDAGEVFRSTTSNNYNAIDPDYIEGKLAFGSFWDGIKMIDIGADGKRSGTAMYNLASRGGGAIEAGSIVHNGSFYYLFVSFDKCCAGTSSTYRTMMGRSSSITGPYTDQSGVAMMNGGGTQLLATNGNEIGPGGGDVSSLPGYYAYHFYDGAANGASKLQIRPITYSNSWPVLGAPIASGCCANPTNTNTPFGSTATRTPTATNPPNTPTRTFTPLPSQATSTRTSTPIIDVITPTLTRTLTIGPSSTPGSGSCSPVTSTITVPFTFDGAGTFCWQASSLGSFINSWNTTSVSVNGMNATNIWVGSGSYPAKINGFYYVSYNSAVAWGHFEAKP